MVSSRRNSISKGSLVGKLGLWEESVGLERRRPEGGRGYRYDGDWSLFSAFKKRQ